LNGIGRILKMGRQVFNKEGYAISDIDESGDTKYYGYLNEVGDYYILKLTDTAARYYRRSAKSDYTADWNNRISLQYDYFNKVF